MCLIGMFNGEIFKYSPMANSMILWVPWLYELVVKSIVISLKLVSQLV